MFSLEPTLSMAHFGEIKLGSSQFDQVKAVLLARGVVLNVEVAVGACLTLICGDEKGLPLAEGEEVQIHDLSPTLTALMLDIEAQLIVADGDINVFNQVCDLIDREMNSSVPGADELDEAA